MARRTGRLDRVVEDERVNAGLGWALVAFLALVSAEEILDGHLLWAGFTAFVGALALVPTVANRDWTVMLPWEVLALAALPIFGRSMATFPSASRVATYLSVAALALIVAVELHVFTAVKMTLGFAITSVVVFTMAAAGTWAVVRWAVFGPSFVASNEALMIEFVYSIVAGGVAALVFEFYVRRTANVDRLPPGVRVK